MTPPYFSVVIPVFNVSDYIQQTLESVLGQTYSNFEIIVVNDGSTDGTLEKLSIYNDSRMRVITTTNKGVSAARNTGIETAKGKYIAFLDGDDVWNKYHLEYAANAFLRFPNIVWYSSRYIINEYVPDNWQNGPFKIACKDYFSEASIFVHSSTVIIKRDSIPRQLFPVDVENAEDWVAWAKIAITHPTIIFSSFQDVLYRYRINSASKRLMNPELKKYMKLLYKLKELTPEKQDGYIEYCHYRTTQRWLLAISRNSTKSWIYELNEFKNFTPWYVKHIVKTYILISYITTKVFSKLLSSIDNYASKKRENKLI